MTKSYQQIEFIVLYKCDCGEFHRHINIRSSGPFYCRKDAAAAAKGRVEDRKRTFGRRARLAYKISKVLVTITE